MTWSDELADARLENETVLLRPLQAHDRDALAQIAFESDIWTYFTTRIDAEADLDAFMTTGLADIAAGRRYVFSVIEKASGRVAGSMSFGNLAEADRRIEIGWSWLGRDFRGRGVNAAAKHVLLRHAFERLGCERVEFKTDVLNDRARRGLRNIGAVEEGVLRSFNYMPGGRRRDAIFYSVLRAEWPAVSERLQAHLELA
ncbi:GNAT family protein [Salinarimonas sp.]|uniref:GNAT family N-acetyltransferase n=1 Tax=Salinarimonas sp. TaxID=2766526 RepID=UPI0032D9A6F7